MALLTITNVKDWIKIAGSGDDTILTQILASAIDKVQEYLNFILEEDIYTDILYDGNGGNKLQPKHFPITTFTKLEVYDGLDSDGVAIWDEYVQNEDYDRLIVIDGGGQIYLDGAFFPWDEQNIRLAYTAGWTTITMPAKIMKALLNLCHLYYTDIRSDKSLGKTSNVQQAGVGSSTVTYDLTAEQKILDSIASFKHWNI